jgi:hypothetical protein
MDKCISIFDIKNSNTYFQLVKFYSFWSSNPWIPIRIRIDLKCLSRIRIETIMRIYNPACRVVKESAQLD